MIHHVRLYLGLVVACASALALVSTGSAVAQPAGCADYSTAAAAQFALDINAGLALTLDPDANGVACDHDEASGANAPTAGGLQLPAEDPTAPAGAAVPAQATIDAINQQPANTTTTTTQQPAISLDGTLGSSRAAFEAVYGAPVEETQDESIPEIVGVTYSPPPTAFDLFTVYDTDEVAIIYIGAETTWDGAGVVTMLQPFLPDDVAELPQPETLDDITYLMTLHSTAFEQPSVSALMTRAGIPGEPGDFYIVLYTEDGSGVYDIEIGLGNGDNVRADFTPEIEPTSGVSVPADLPVPTMPPTEPVVQTTTVDATTFLANTRADVDQLQQQIASFRAIFAAATFTDAEIDQLSVITSEWLAIDTSLPPAPPEHSQMAQQMQQVRLDISTVGMGMVLFMAEPEGFDVTETANLLDSAELSLSDLDQQLTALGF